MASILSSPINLYNTDGPSHAMESMETSINILEGNIHLLASKNELTELQNSQKTMYGWVSEIDLSLDKINLAVSNSKYESIEGVLSALEDTEASITIEADKITQMIQNNYVTKNDMNGYVDEQVKSINESISTANKNITTITSEYQSMNSELETLKQTVSSSISQTAEDITIKFNQALDSINNLSSSTDDKFNDLSTYIRFDSNGIELGEVNNPIKLNITNDSIIFSNAGAQLAKMEGQLLTIERTHLVYAEVEVSLRIGSFVWEPRTNGNLSLIRK